LIDNVPRGTIYLFFDCVPQFTFIIPVHCFTI